MMLVIVLEQVSELRTGRRIIMTIQLSSIDLHIIKYLLRTCFRGTEYRKNTIICQWNIGL